VQLVNPYRGYSSLGEFLLTQGDPQQSERHRAHTAGVAFDAQLAERVRHLLAGEDGLRERRMFGGLAFLVHGNMAVSASSQGGLLLRVDPADTAALVESPHAERFEMRGRAMDGWLRISPEGVVSDEQLRQWVRRGIGYARSLPPKPEG
jgi:TfoX/Sxy family transcriptional regulator of competence genes